MPGGNNPTETTEVKIMRDSSKIVILKFKNKKYGKTFLKAHFNQKYKLLNEFILGVEENLNYNIISNNTISRVFIEVSPFVQLRYKLFRNLF